MKISSTIAATVRILCCAVCIWILLPAAQAQDVVYPDKVVVNVKEYNAKGDGQTDDTEAIQQAIQANGGTLYFPNGTYLISNTLEWRDGSGKWRAFMKLQGQSQARTIIRLQNACAGFGDTREPKPLIKTASQNTFDPSYGPGAEAFNNGLSNLTIDVGSQNPGAIGVSFLSNNEGGINDVTIQSSDPDWAGAKGLDMTTEWPGPCLIKNLTIIGFDYGMDVGFSIYSNTFEHIVLQHQRTLAIRNQTNTLSFRDLKSHNSVPVLQNSNDGLVTILDGSFDGGNDAQFAITNTAHLYVHNLMATGYQAAVQNNGAEVAGNYLSEFTSQKPFSLFDSPLHSLNLPVQETPEYMDNDFAHWRSVSAKPDGAIPDDYGDDTEAIQRALDSGASTVYFPPGSYRISGTLTVPASVRRVLGLSAGVDFGPGDKFSDVNSPTPVFQVATGGEPLFFEGLDVTHNDQGVATAGSIFLQHTGARPLILRNILSFDDGIDFYLNGPGAGNLYIENVSCRRTLHFAYPQQVWARQLNPEGDLAKPLIINNGATVWILGLKTEGATTAIATIGGGQTELLGGLLYPVSSVDVALPAFINDNSSVSLVYAVSASDTDKNYSVQVQETRNGFLKTLTRTEIPASGAGSRMPLYVGYGDSLDPSNLSAQ